MTRLLHSRLDLDPFDDGVTDFDDDPTRLDYRPPYRVPTPPPVEEIVELWADEPTIVGAWPPAPPAPGPRRVASPMLALVLLVGCGGAKWTATDTAWQGAVTASLAADFVQTRTALNADYDEMNPVMGADGDRVAPEIYFPACAALSAGAAVALPGRWRRVFQIAVIGVQTAAIVHNARAGVGLGWTF